MPTRRQFIQVGFAGAALLAGVRWLDGAFAAPAPSYLILDEASARAMVALVPVVLAGSLPPDEEARANAVRDVVASFDRAVSVLAPAIQGEVGELFAVLNFAPTRIGFAGLWAPIEESTPEELRTFLDRWRKSRFALQRVSYQALTQLIQASWYDTPLAWKAIGYPGPPRLNP